jgi:nucleotide-binding universal stress UspA family protein
MKTIIIATDFSATALNAAQYAIQLAEVVHADVLLVNVFEVLANYGEIAFDVNVDKLTKDATDDLNKLKDELLFNTKVNITTAVRLGVFFEELETVCNETKPYAVVMGSQGKTATERFFFGSHVLDAMRELEWPVITVPPKAIFNKIYRIGLAYDFEKAIEDTITEKIKMTATDFNAEIHVLNFESEDNFDAEYVSTSNKLERDLKPFELKFHFVASNHIDKSIVEFVDKNYINLLIIMPKHHTVIEKMFSKSHSKTLVIHSHVPILSLRK